MYGNGNDERWMRRDEAGAGRNAALNCRLSTGNFLFHLATAAGPGGIAVVEVYGEGAAAALARLFAPRGGRMPGEGEVRRGVLRDAGGEEVDEVLLASLPPRASWCGLGSWTVSSHGGTLVERRLRRALSLAGGREAGRGEIVSRAVSRGALGPLEGEALLVLPEARTGRAARYLLGIAAGSLSRRMERVEGMARAGDLAGARAELEAMLRAAPSALHLLSPRRVLIAGRPNAGKSSLFNRLAERERAAVTPAAGTTRDLLEETVEVGGYPVVLMDSSGLRREEEAADAVEREGMRRARAAAGDCVLYLMDHPGTPGPDEAEFLETLPPERVLLVRTKSDLWGSSTSAASRQPPAAVRELCVSARTGEGLDRLRARIREEWLGPPEEEDLPPAPFTGAVVEAVRRAADSSSIDELRRALVQCLPDLEGGEERLNGMADPR